MYITVKYWTFMENNKEMKENLHACQKLFDSSKFTAANTIQKC